MKGRSERAEKLIRLLGALVFIVFVFAFLGIPIPGLDVLFYLVAGWGWFVARVGPRLHIRWSLVASTLVYAVALLFVANYFLRWLYREMYRAGQWRWRWTFSGLLIVMLMFTAGIAAVGIVHQSAWLATSPEPIFKPGRNIEMANRVKCGSNLRQIGQALQLYAMAHGDRYPDDFGTLLTSPDADLVTSVFVCPSSNDEPSTARTPAEQARDLSQPHRCSYIYVAQGLTFSYDPKQVIAYEALADHQNHGMNVLYGDGHVDWLEQPEAEVLIRRLGQHPSSSPATAPGTTSP